jgi:putative membrane protein
MYNRAMNEPINQRAIDEILTRFGISQQQFLGQGIESRVYAVDSKQILRIYKRANKYIQEARAELYNLLSQHQLPFDIPTIYLAEEFDGIAYTLEKRFTGQDFSKLLLRLEGNNRKRALESYLLAASAFSQIQLSDKPYGELLSKAHITAPTWPAYLQARISQEITKSKTISADVPHFPTVLSKVCNRINTLDPTPKKSLVHGDFYPANVFVDDSMRVTAVGDFSGLTAVGDFRMDLAGAIYFPGIFNYFTDTDEHYLEELARTLYDDEIGIILTTYKLYYSALFSNGKDYDPPAYAWSVRNLVGIS